MNTFTFTDDEVVWLIESIKTSDIDGSEGEKHLDSCLDKLERKPRYIIGHTGPRLTDVSETIVKNGAVFIGTPKEK